MKNPFQLIRELDACDGRAKELGCVLEELCEACYAQSAWFMVIDVFSQKDVVWIPLRFPQAAKEWTGIDGVHAHHLWFKLAGSVESGEPVRTESAERSEILEVMGDFFARFDIIETLGFAIELNAKEVAGVALFRPESEGPFGNAAERHCMRVVDGFHRFARRNWVHRNCANPYCPDAPSLAMFRERVREKGISLPGRVSEACWLFYQDFSAKSIAERMRPTPGKRPTGELQPPSTRTVAAYLDAAREIFGVSSRVGLMRVLERVVGSPFPGDR